MHHHAVHKRAAGGDDDYHNGDRIYSSALPAGHPPLGYYTYLVWTCHICHQGGMLVVNDSDTCPNPYCEGDSHVRCGRCTIQKIYSQESA